MAAHCSSCEEQHFSADDEVALQLPATKECHTKVFGNLLLDYLRKRNACFNASENNDGTADKVVSELLRVYWYLNGQEKKFENAAGVDPLPKQLVFRTC